MSSNSTRAVPSDLELMAYADGELEGERLAAVEAYLGAASSRSPAHRKLSALHLTSDLVREEALGSSSADGIADLVMAQIAAENGHSAEPKLAPVVDLRPPRAVQARAGKAANDNSRRIYAFAAAAVAAAAALMIWGRSALGPEPGGPTALGTAPAWTAPPAAPTPDLSAEPTPAPEDERGAEVAAVDFGGHNGSIFYVPSGVAASNATTTVVWLNDDAAGEK